MLVLSRSEGDALSFPDLEMTIEILKVQGKRVQVGVEADRSIRVVRSELTSQDSTKSRPKDRSNRLTIINETRQMLAEVERHLDDGQTETARRVLVAVIERLENEVQSQTVVSESKATYQGGNGETKRNAKEQIRLLDEVLKRLAGEVATEGMAC